MQKGGALSYYCPWPRGPDVAISAPITHVMPMQYVGNQPAHLTLPFPCCFPSPALPLPSPHSQPPFFVETLTQDVKVLFYRLNVLQKHTSPNIYNYCIHRLALRSCENVCLCEVVKIINHVWEVQFAMIVIINVIYMHSLDFNLYVNAVVFDEKQKQNVNFLHHSVKFTFRQHAMTRRYEFVKLG